MLRIAILALVVALVAGIFGMGGVSNFAIGVSQFFFSVWGIFLVVALVIAFAVVSTLSRRAL